MKLTPRALSLDPDVIAENLPLFREVLQGKTALLPYSSDFDYQQVDDLLLQMRFDQPTDESTALIVHTSGSTGTPKGAQISHSALHASIEATNARLSGPGQWILWLPPYHVAGVLTILRSLQAGQMPIVLTRSTTWAQLAESINHLVSGVAHYLSLVPVQLERAIRYIEDHPDGPTLARQLRRLDAILVGGMSADGELLEAARRHQLPVVTTYGASETCGGCVYDGVPLDGVTVSIGSNSDPMATPSDGRGRIWISGPTLADGYKNIPNHPAFAIPGWYRTDDEGYLDEDGKLVVLGRVDGAINSAGLKVLPSEVERIIDQLCDRESLVFGVPDRDWGEIVVAVVEQTCPPEESRGLVVESPQLRESIRDAMVQVRTPREMIPRRVFEIQRFMRNDMGKIARDRVISLVKSRL